MLSVHVHMFLCVALLAIVNINHTPARIRAFYTSIVLMILLKVYLCVYAVQFSYGPVQLCVYMNGLVHFKTYAIVYLLSYFIDLSSMHT